MVPCKRAMARRRFLQGAALAGVGLASNASFGGLVENAAPKPAAMPKINLGGFEASRLLMGSNPFWGFWHGNPRNPQEYSDAGRMAAMDAAADAGVNAIWTPAYEMWIDLWKRYKDGGGRLETWIGQPDGYYGVGVEDQIRACAATGGRAVCVQGERVDNAMDGGDLDTLRRWIGMIKDLGLPAGLASHKPETLLRAADASLPADFFHLTLGVPDSFKAEDREKTLRTVREIGKPMIVFKVMGAGRFDPAEAIPQTLARIGEGDGICVGVDGPAQLAQNAQLVANAGRG